MDKVASKSVRDGGVDASPADHSPAASITTSISLKLPAFWPKATKIWLAQADAQFSIKNVTVSKMKFYHHVAVLPQELAAQLLDIIMSPPAVNP